MTAYWFVVKPARKEEWVSVGISPFEISTSEILGCWFGLFFFFPVGKLWFIKKYRSLFSHLPTVIKTIKTRKAK